MRRIAGKLVHAALERRGSRLNPGAVDGVVAHSFYAAAARLRIEEDEALAWLWLAGSMGHRRAVAQILRILELDILKSGAEAGGVLTATADSWETFARMMWSDAVMTTEKQSSRTETAFLEDVEDPKGLAKLRAARQPQPAAQESQPTRLPDAENGIVVFESIGDPTSKEGTDLNNRYGGFLGVRLGWQGRIPELDEVYEGILARWPWARSAAMHLETRFSLLRAGNTDAIRISPLLFVGPPGSGKSSIARWVCEAAGLHTTLVPCGAVSDGGGFGAVTRGWATARPGMLATTMFSERICNPAVILDELEKTTAVGSQNGSMMSALLSMVMSSSYHDTCLQAPVDLTGVSFIATANSLKSIDSALLDRFEVVRIPGPTEDHFDNLLHTVGQDFMTEHAIPDDRLPELGANSLELLRLALRQNPSVRAFSGLYRKFMREAIHRRERELARGMDALRQLQAPPAPNSVN